MSNLDTVSIPINICNQCGNKWLSIRLAGRKPKRCPQCQSYNWEKPMTKRQPIHRLQELYGDYMRAYNARTDGPMMTFRMWREKVDRERLEKRAERLAGGL